LFNKNDVSDDLIKLKEYFEKCINHLDVPFEQLKMIIDIYSEVLPTNKEFDNLTDVSAEIEASRVSEKVAGKRYLNRGIVKLENNLNKDSLIFFGKAVRKLAKEETQNEFYLCLLFLSNAYSNLGLYWAANNSLISAINIYANNWYTTGTIHPRFLRGV
jgi:tetratricopeptide (TPR) repeat protein